MFAKKVSHLVPTGAFEFLGKAKALEAQGKSIIHLEIGEPDFHTPDNIKDAAIKAIKDNFTGYVISQGIPELRKTIATHIAATRKINITPDEVVVGVGASSIIFYCITTLVEQGDEVIYPDPGFFTYEPVTVFAGGIPKPIRFVHEHGFGIDIEELKSKLSPKTKLLILNSPHNPTGGMIEHKEMEELARVLRDKKIWVLSDEVYSEMVYDGGFCSIASYPEMKDKTIIIDSFSKTYAMTGWRLGYGVMDKTLANQVTSLLIQCNSCTPPFIQAAGIEALTGQQNILNERLETYRKRRDIIVNGLNQIPGFKCAMPKGAFYAFPNVKAYGLPSRELALKLLHETGVACLPGTVFGRFGEDYIRFTYSNSESNILEALKRIRQFVK
ncbi:MAG: pyridoxal phosphate-dependent aminotransferase [Candidatus Stahlbacteria bacterium]|nr:pyridoxal phosphate-dependent aminotransferase [Candidatus Stahlbacteria bacterium]